MEGNRGSIRLDSGMQRLRRRVSFHSWRTGILSIPRVHQLSQAVPVLPQRPARTAPRQLRRRAAAADTAAPGNPSQSCAATAALTPQCPSDHGGTARFTVATASRRCATPDALPCRGGSETCPYISLDQVAGRHRSADSVCLTKTCASFSLSWKARGLAPHLRSGQARAGDDGDRLPPDAVRRPGTAL